MASAGTVTLNLDANSVKLLRELQKSERASRKTSRQMRREFTAAFKAIALASAVVGAAFGRMIQQSVKAQDEMSKMSRTLGVSTEMLSQLEFAAKISGTSLEGLQKGLLRLSRTASDASNGLATAKRSFDAIGVSAQKQDGSLKDTGDLLLEVADRFASLEDGAAKAALAQELFGRAGAQLIPFLNQGRDGIEKLTAEADRLGLTIGTDAAKAAEQFNDNMVRVQSAVRGVVNQTAQRLLPTLEAMSDRFIEGITKTDGMTRAVDQLEAAFKTLVSTGMVVASSFQAIGTILGAGAAAIVQRDFSIIRDAYNDLRADATDTIETIAGMWGPAVARAATEIEEPAARIREALKFGMDEASKDPLASLRESVATFGLSNIDKELAKLANAEGMNPALLEDARQMLEWLRDSADAAQVYEQRQADIKSAIESTLTPAERFVAEIEKLNDLRPDLGMEAYTRGVIAAQERLTAATAEAQDQIAELDQFAIQAARNLQSHFANFLFDPFEDGLKGMLRGFIDTMRRMVAEAAASQIFGAMFPASGGGLGGALSGFFGGARADGGPVSSGKAYLVGERGPELFVSSGSGSIIPNGGFGASITFNIDARGADAQLTRALPAILEQQAQRIKGDIAESMSRRRGLR